MRLTAADLALRSRRIGCFFRLNLSVKRPGHVVTGANGAGKTSLLRLLAGLLPPSTGAVTLAGGEPEATLAEQAHYLGHQDALKPSLTVGENLEFWARHLAEAATVSRPEACKRDCKPGASLR